ncbi:MAG: hypothetical protein VX836_09730 [Pseudomonadota bacterium]|nr:hypothetical protein [Pseudomonadota bacterium]
MPDLKMFESALTRLQVSRYGELVQLVMPGEGALIVPTTEFTFVQKWAQRRNSTGSPIRDRALVLEKLDTVIARSGSLVSTRGSRKPLETLVRAMRGAGFAPEEWNLPTDLKTVPKPDSGIPAKPKAGNAAETGDPQDDEQPDSPDVDDPD